jgi:hypothetical protein
VLPDGRQEEVQMSSIARKRIVPRIDGAATTPTSPGVSVSLDLSLTNPYAVSMSVTGLHLRNGTITAPTADAARECDLEDFLVFHAAAAGRLLTVSPSTRSSLDRFVLARAGWPYVGMLDRSVNHDGCKGASLTLAHSASGTASP